MVDVNGTPVEVGDKVAYCSTHYSSLKVGYVTKVTPNGVRVGIHENQVGLVRHRTQIAKL